MKFKKLFSVMLVIAVTFSSIGAMAAEKNPVIEKVSEYNSLMQNPDGGIMEIIAYNEKNQYAYAVNGQSGLLAIIPLIENTDLTAEDFDIQAVITSDDFAYGDMTSVAVSPSGESLAVAIQAEDYAACGKVAIFDCNDDGSLEFVTAVDVGIQPDMVIFYDENTILTADEGEPRAGYGEGTIDPMGSVSIVDIKNYSSTIVDFSDFDEKREELVEKSIILKKNTNPSVDLEPEYIAIADSKAYITLQEANAIAVLDVENKIFSDIFSLGFEDYSENAIDIDKKDEAYNPQVYDSLLGIRMADGIAAYETNGITYIITANEGDSREWGEYLNESEINFGKGKTSPTGAITAENSTLSGKVVFLAPEDYDGLDEEKDYLFGGRSFTVYEVTEGGINEIYTSGNDFERITAEKFPEYFNCSNDDKTIDDRSGKKGPEPEAVIVGEVSGRSYAFIALERIGGIMVYDITDPTEIFYTGYVNSREFTDDIAGDVAPEGLCFVSRDKNSYGKDLLLAACEVSGTVAVYTVEQSNEVAQLPFEATKDDIVITESEHSISVSGEFLLNEGYEGELTLVDGDRVTVVVSYLKNGTPYVVNAVEATIKDGKINVPESRLSCTEKGEYFVAGISVLSNVTPIEAIKDGNMGIPVAAYKP